MNLTFLNDMPYLKTDTICYDWYVYAVELKPLHLRLYANTIIRVITHCSFMVTQLLTTSLIAAKEGKDDYSKAWHLWWDLLLFKRLQCTNATVNYHRLPRLSIFNKKPFFRLFINNRTFVRSKITVLNGLGYKITIYIKQFS